MRLALLSVFLALPILATAKDWPVVAADEWAGDASVGIEYRFTADTETGAVIGIAELMIGPLMPGEPRLVPAAQFEGTGRTVCLVANAVRGTVRSVAASRCQSFWLAPPILPVP